MKNKEIMEMNEYQYLAGRTRNNELDKNKELSNYSMGLAGETGEVVDLLKKIVFHGHKMDLEKLKDELGDVLWYVANLATTLDLNLEDIAEFNIEKLQKRYPRGFSEEKSINRKKEEMKEMIILRNKIDYDDKATRIAKKIAPKLIYSIEEAIQITRIILNEYNKDGK